MAAPQATSTRRRGGRPKKADHERMAAALHAECTLAEKQFVRDQRVAAGGISEAEYVRRCCLGQPVIVRQGKSDARLIHELNAIGVNMNQISRNLNSGRVGVAGSTLADLDHLMSQLRETLHRAAEQFDD